MVGDGIAPGSTVLCPHCRNQFVMSSAPAEAAPGPGPAPAGPGPSVPGAGPAQAPAGPQPGPAPAAPRAGPAPGAGTVPAPTVQAVWSDVGRRRSPMEASSFLLGAGLVFVFVAVIVVIFIVVLNARPPERGPGPGTTGRSGTVDLNAKVSCSPTEMRITNLDPFAWTDVKVGINPRDGGGFWALVTEDEERYTEPGLYVRLPYSRFEDSTGVTFDASGADVKTVVIKATTSEGPGERTVKQK